MQRVTDEAYVLRAVRKVATSDVEAALRGCRGGGRDVDGGWWSR